MNMKFYAVIVFTLIVTSPLANMLFKHTNVPFWLVGLICGLVCASMVACLMFIANKCSKNQNDEERSESVSPR